MGQGSASTDVERATVGVEGLAGDREGFYGWEAEVWVAGLVGAGIRGVGGAAGEEGFLLRRTWLYIISFTSNPDRGVVALRWEVRWRGRDSKRTGK